jgi:hypothetical protein
MKWVPKSVENMCAQWNRPTKAYTEQNPIIIPEDDNNNAADAAEVQGQSQEEALLYTGQVEEGVIVKEGMGEVEGSRSTS